jgi:glucuronosyltransferase
LPALTERHHKSNLLFWKHLTIFRVILKLFKIRSFLEINFIWKYERPEDNIAKNHQNVITSSWVDQPKILTHPRLLAFITHCGLNSVTQSSYAGVPMICIRKYTNNHPYLFTLALFADQTRNGAMIESRGLGVRLDKFTLNSQKITEALREVVFNEKYGKES